MNQMREEIKEMLKEKVSKQTMKKDHSHVLE
jgi:hypothetical protein